MTLLLKNIAVAVIIAATAMFTVACTSMPIEEPAVPSGTAGEFAPDHSEAQWVENLSACLVDSGFAVTVSPDNGLSFSAETEAQSIAYDLALAVCEKQFGYDKPPRPLSREDVLLQYEDLVNLARCLRDQNLDPGPDPSIQTFVDGYFSGEFYWDPYGEVAAPPDAQVTQEEYYALLQVCPRP